VSDSAIYRRDQHGVLLRYPIDVRPPAQPRNSSTDRERMTLIKAERELAALEIILEHLDVSDIAMVRIADALNTIGKALDVERTRLGLAPRSDAPA
jgi:hypothetical protein